MRKVYLEATLKMLVAIDDDVEDVVEYVHDHVTLEATRDSKADVWNYDFDNLRVTDSK